VTENSIQNYKVTIRL